jgi:hypothetical protein
VEDWIMPFGLTDEVVSRVLVEETTGLEPNEETAKVPIEFRLRIRAEIEAIEEAGQIVDVPLAFPDVEDGVS